MYKRKIIVNESETILHADDFSAPVYFLKLKDLSLEEKRWVSFYEICLKFWLENIFSKKNLKLSTLSCLDSDWMRNPRLEKEAVFDS